MAKSNFTKKEDVNTAVVTGMVAQGKKVNDLVDKFGVSLATARRLYLDAIANQVAPGIDIEGLLGEASENGIE